MRTRLLPEVGTRARNTIDFTGERWYSSARALGVRATALSPKSVSSSRGAVRVSGGYACQASDLLVMVDELETDARHADNIHNIHASRRTMPVTVPTRHANDTHVTCGLQRGDRKEKKNWGQQPSQLLPATSHFSTLLLGYCSPRMPM
jgi:hypothetical protein